jgi:geranylgeranylglycerol-phosphate geranylgeranyltransferase
VSIITAYIRLVRLHNVVGATLGDVMGYLVSSKWAHVSLVTLTISALVVGLVAAGGYVINDVFDVEIDRINKPDRPIPAGKVSLRSAKILSACLFALGILLSIWINLYALVVSFLTALMLYAYASHLKKTGVWGNFVVSLTTSLSIFFGAIAAERGYELVAIPTLYSFTLTMCREIVKGVEDYEGDSLNNVKTLAVSIGVERAWGVIRKLLIVLMILAPLPIALGYNISYVTLIAIFYVYVIRTYLTESSIRGGAKGREYLKVAAVVAILAFLFGSYPGLSLQHVINEFP